MNSKIRIDWTDGWLGKIGLLGTGALLVIGLLGAAEGQLGLTFAFLCTIGIASAPLIWMEARRNSARAITAALALGSLLTTFACAAVMGTFLGLATALVAPWVVFAGAALSTSAAFFVADAMVLAWAAVLGLSAGGLFPIGPELSFGAAHPVLELAFPALVFNTTALACYWGMRDTQPDRAAELAASQIKRQQLEAELESIQSLALAGRLVTHVAHEVSNPLQAMDNFLFVLLDGTPEGDERRRHLMMVKQGIDRITQYLEQLSDFYRPSEAGGTADLNQIIADVFRFLERQLENSDVKVTQKIENGLPRARISEERLRQVVLNIVLNAAEAMSGGGELSVTTSHHVDRVSAEFQDSGGGIAQNELEHIFEPFFTTKSDQGGTGLGLSICQRILRSQGGELVAESELGIGTRMIVSLPVAKPGTRAE